MNSKIFFIFLEIFLFCLINAQRKGLVTQEFQMVGKEQYLLVPGTFGDQEVGLLIDLSIDRTWIDQNDYQFAQSKTYKTNNTEETKLKDGFGIMGVLSSETFLFEKKYLHDFNFLLVKSISGSTDINSGLGLGREFSDESYSLVHHLKKNTFINVNSFSLKFYDDNLRHGQLLIGDVDFDSNQNGMMNSCKLIVDEDNKSRWTCNLTHIFVGERSGGSVEYDSEIKKNLYKIDGPNFKIKEVNQKASFESIYGHILIPQRKFNEFAEYLKKNYFTYPDVGSLCREAYDTETNEHTFVCTIDEVFKLQDLNFVFDGIVDIHFSAKELFSCVEDVCTFLIGTKDNVEHFVMGVNVLKKFQFIFQYNSPELYFIGDSNVDLVKMGAAASEEPKPKKESGISFFLIVGYIILVLIICVTICLFIIYLLRKKNETKKAIEAQIYDKVQ